ncbi:MAG: hypothetical protein K1X53_02390 [Candidatus Sumerlaeaceae bacterium]|nr:hypothetical protein [Candidatus Sumerlaeaceae bacterium]
MLIPGFLSAVAAGLMLWALAVLLKTPKSLRERRALSLIIAGGFLVCALTAVICVGSTLQEVAGVSLGLPGTVQGKARQWLKTHEAEPPDPRNVGRNIKILSAGLDFYQAYQTGFPADLRIQMERYTQLPLKPTRLLSVADESKYHEAASGVFSIMRQLAAEDDSAQTSNKAAKTK